MKHICPVSFGLRFVLQLFANNKEIYYFHHEKWITFTSISKIYVSTKTFSYFKQTNKKIMTQRVKSLGKTCPLIEEF